MKVTKEHFERLKRECFETLKAHGLHPYMVQNSRHAWDTASKAGSPLWMYEEGYNDDHIATALKKIFKR